MWSIGRSLDTERAEEGRTDDAPWNGRIRDAAGGPCAACNAHASTTIITRIARTNSAILIQLYGRVPTTFRVLPLMTTRYGVSR